MQDPFELTAAAAKAFGTIDARHNGRVSLADIHEFAQAHADERSQQVAHFLEKNYKTIEGIVPWHQQPADNGITRENLELISGLAPGRYPGGPELFSSEEMDFLKVLAAAGAGALVGFAAPLAFGPEALPISAIGTIAGAALGMIGATGYQIFQEREAENYYKSILRQINQMKTRS